MFRRLVAAALLLALPATAARAETLNLLIWESYISPRVVDAWTRETGTTLNQIYFDGGADRDRIIADGNSEIDLAIMEQRNIGIFRRKGLLVETSEAAVPSIANAAPRWRDRCAGFGLPYFWGTLGIVYRADRLATAPTSWADLVRPAPALSGHIAMVATADDMLTPALILAGKSINTQDAADLKAAFAILKAQSPAVLTYDYVMTSAQNEKTGPDIVMALAYSGDQFALGKMDGRDWRYVLPKEGSTIWVDCLGVLSASRHRALALRFLDFLGRPEIAAMNAADLSMPSANAAAMPLLPAAMRDDPQIFPPEGAVASSTFAEESQPQTMQIRKRIAESLLSLHDAH